jgi:hypothetical protein
MSNDKQETAVKLYTEEQLTRYLLDEGIMELSDLANNLVPCIELPSNEELYINSNIESDNVEQHIGFIKGLELMRELIQGGIDGD